MQLRSRRDLRQASIAILFVLVLGIASPALASGGGGLVLIPDAPLLIALVVGFVVLIFPLNKLIFAPIFGVLDRRDERIAGARDRAATLHQQADGLLARYQEEVNEVREEAESSRQRERDTARTERARIATEARDQALREVERSREELASALGETRAALRSSTEELAREVAGQVLGRPVS